MPSRAESQRVGVLQAGLTSLPRRASHSPLLHTARPVCAERSFSLLGGSRNFFQVSFFLSKGHCAQDALFLAARPLCEGRKLTVLVTMQIATVKAS